jgi:CRP-like cAMP-binding protein
MTAEKNPFARFLTRFEQGHILFHEGDDGEEMFIIQSGRVAIKKKVKEGETTLAVLEKGDFFGEMSVLERLPRSATAEMIEPGEIIVIAGDTFGDMIKANPEIAVRMLRKYSIRLRETNKQIEAILSTAGGPGVVAPPKAQEIRAAAPRTDQTIQTEALAYFVSASTGNVFPAFKGENLIGRFDSVTGMAPEIDLSNEDQSRNISRRHARLVIRDGQFFVAEEIGTMNGTFLNGKKLANGVLTPIADGDELMLCRLALTFKGPQAH